MTQVVGGRGGGVRTPLRMVLGIVAWAVTFLTGLFAAVLIVHILLTLGSANPTNPITIFFRDGALSLNMVGELFVPQSPALAAILNFGIAALIWLIIGAIIARILRMIAP